MRTTGSAAVAPGCRRGYEEHPRRWQKSHRTRNGNRSTCFPLGTSKRATNPAQGRVWGSCITVSLSERDRSAPVLHHTLYRSHGLATTRTTTDWHDTASLGPAVTRWLQLEVRCQHTGSRAGTSSPTVPRTRRSGVRSAAAGRERGCVRNFLLRARQPRSPGPAALRGAAMARPARRGCALPAAGSGAGQPSRPAAAPAAAGEADEAGAARAGQRSSRGGGRCGARARESRRTSAPAVRCPFPSLTPHLAAAPRAHPRSGSPGSRSCGTWTAASSPRPVPNHIKGGGSGCGRGGSRGEGGGDDGGRRSADGERGAPPATCGEGRRGRGAEGRRSGGPTARDPRRWQQRRRPPHVTGGLASPSRTCASRVTGRSRDPAGSRRQAPPGQKLAASCPPAPPRPPAIGQRRGSAGRDWPSAAAAATDGVQSGGARGGVWPARARGDAAGARGPRVRSGRGPRSGRPRARAGSVPAPAPAPCAPQRDRGRRARGAAEPAPRPCAGALAAGGSWRPASRSGWPRALPGRCRRAACPQSGTPRGLAHVSSVGVPVRQAGRQLPRREGL